MSQIKIVIAIGIIFQCLLMLVELNNTWQAHTDHGMPHSTMVNQSIECTEWSFGPWGNKGCEDVYEYFIRYKDGCIIEYSRQEFLGQWPSVHAITFGGLDNKLIITAEGVTRMVGK